MSGQGTPVHCLGTVLLPDDETCFLRYEAPSAAAVEEAAGRAEIEFERVLEARELQGQLATDAADAGRIG
jgi:hypothetical protein